MNYSVKRSFLKTMSPQIRGFERFRNLMAAAGIKTLRNRPHFWGQMWFVVVFGMIVFPLGSDLVG